tara:strand:+ start:932 stop:1147 length:216 start_codon:yes stop_codon:yes gene_type:complete
LSDDEGWFSITISDEEKHPRVLLNAGGFPDAKTAMWFVSELEEFMQYLVSRGEMDDDENDVTTHSGSDMIN